MTFEEWWKEFDIATGPSYEKRDLAELAFEAGRVEGREQMRELLEQAYALIADASLPVKQKQVDWMNKAERALAVRKEGA